MGAIDIEGGTGATDIGHEQDTTAEVIVGDRAREILESTPLDRLVASPWMITAIEAGAEKGLRPIELPEVLELLKGISLDGVGVVGGLQAPDRFLTPTERWDQWKNGQNVEERIGVFDVNNGVLAYRDECGMDYVAPASQVLIEALKNAGYHQDSMHVACSNGEFPANESLARQLEKAKLVARTVDFAALLHTKFGVDRRGEIDALLSSLDDPRSTLGRQLAAMMENFKEALETDSDAYGRPPEAEEPLQESGDPAYQNDGPR